VDMGADLETFNCTLAYSLTGPRRGGALPRCRRFCSASGALAYAATPAVSAAPASKARRNASASFPVLNSTRTMTVPGSPLIVTKRTGSQRLWSSQLRIFASVPARVAALMRASTIMLEPECAALDKKDRDPRYTRQQADQAIGRYIDGFYNPIRRHSALDFTSPAQFEKMA